MSGIIWASGSICIDVLAKLRGGPSQATDPVEVAAGASAYGWRRVVDSEAAEYKFTVGPDQTEIEFSALFFPDAPMSACRQLADAERLSGEVTRAFSPDEPGLVWAQWKNSDSWFSGMQ